MLPLLLLAAALFGARSTCRVVDGPAAPIITPAPVFDARELRKMAAAASSVNLISMAEVLITGVPASLRSMVLTNFPEASRLIWSEFLDGNRPDWFTSLPTDIQTELIREFSPTTADASSPTPVTSSSSSPPSPSATGAPTSFVTVTATPVVASSLNSNGGATSGLSTASKVGIGLGVPLAVLLLVLIVAAACLLGRGRQRRRRQSVMTEHDVSERAPTPPFLASTMAPARTAGIPRRWGYGTRDGGCHEDANPFIDPAPPATAIGARLSGGGSSGSLPSVPEETLGHKQRNDDSPILPVDTPRYSRRSLAEQKRWSGGSDSNAALSPLNPAFGGGDAAAATPFAAAAGDRNSGSFASPAGPSAANTSPIRRKPVGSPVSEGAGVLENSHGFGRDDLPSRTPRRDSDTALGTLNGKESATSDHRQVQWPFHRDDYVDVPSAQNGNGLRRGGNQRPKYNHYKQVYAEA